MSPTEIGTLSVVAMIALMYSGMHVPTAFCLVSLLGVWGIKGDFTQAMALLAVATTDAISTYDYGVIPLFVLMGLLVGIADLGRDAFLAANALLGRIKGGLGVATVGANALFATVTGVSIVSATVFTKIAVPEMARMGYRPRFAVGVVAGSSVLGMLIPPSLLFIVYGLLAEQSIGQLFIAGIVPGLVLAAAFSITIIVMANLTPSLIYASGARADDGERIPFVMALAHLLPLMVLAGVVVGGMYAGWFTATESGAVGALGGFVLAAWRRKLTWRAVWHMLVETGQITTAVLLVVIAASIYTRLIALSGLSGALNDAVVGAKLGFVPLLLIYAVIIVLLGTMIDAVSIMLIMVPMFLPLLAPFNINLVWFGVVTVLAAEIGLITPPFGLSVFAIKAAINDERISLNDIFAGSLPFAAVMFAVLLLIIFFPSLTTVLL
jgi:tripartite ATP-independent transporter DctM subunit